MSSLAYPRLSAPATLTASAQPGDSHAVLGSVEDVKKYGESLGCSASLLRDVEQRKGAPVVAYNGDGEHLALVGLQTKPDTPLKPEDYISGAAAVINGLKPYKTDGVELICPNATEDVYVSAAYAALLTNYHFDKYLTDDEKKPHLFKRVALPEDALNVALHNRVQVLADSVCFARDLSNERADVMGAEGIEKVARTLAHNSDFRIRVVKGEQVEEERLRLLQAVGQSATEEPRMIVLEYHGGEPSDPWTVVVGKV